MAIRSKPHAFNQSPAVIGSIPVPPPPTADDRARFARRRQAGHLAEAMASAVGRSAREAGTARLALLIAAEAGGRLDPAQSQLAGTGSEETPAVVVTPHASRSLDPRELLGR